MEDFHFDANASYEELLGTPSTVNEKIGFDLDLEFLSSLQA